MIITSKIFMILMWLFGLFLNIKPIFVHKDIEMNVKVIMVFLLGFQGISLYHLGLSLIHI